MFDGNWRGPLDRALVPIGTSIRRAGISADLITVVGIVMAASAAVAIGLGAMELGLLLLILTGVPDALDGAVAKASGTASVRGAFFDSVSDRFTDALLFGGVAWYLASTRADHTMMLPVAIMALAMLVSYQRAKAEALGFDAKGGIMERAERFVVLGFGLLFSGILVGTLWVMLILTAVTAVQRFVKVWRQASAARPLPSRPARRRRSRPRRSGRQPLAERLAARRAERED